MAEVEKMWNDPADEWAVEKFGILYGCREEVIWGKIIGDIKIDITCTNLFYEKKQYKMPYWTIKVYCWNQLFEMYSFQSLFVEYDSIKKVNRLINQITDFGLSMPIK